MKSTLTILILLLCTYGSAHEGPVYYSDYTHVSGTVSADESPDLSIFLRTKEFSYDGIFDSSCYRIQMHFETVRRDPKNPNRYLITGSDRLKGRVTSFSGFVEIEKTEIAATNIYGEADSLHYIDFKTRVYLQEDATKYGAGVFSGTMAFTLNQYPGILVDDLFEWMGDGYSNYAFKGTWKSNKTSAEKLCEWGDGHFTDFPGFDIGAGELSAGPKYRKNGWETNEDGSFRDNPSHWWQITTK
jgi:hypothetical protein